MEKYLGSQLYNYEENAIDKKCPGCAKLVTFVPDSKSLSSKDGKSLKISHSVDCGNGHYFCWECGKLQGHAPVSCGLWSKWLEKCVAMDSSGFFTWLNRYVFSSILFSNKCLFYQKYFYAIFQQY